MFFPLCTESTEMCMKFVCECWHLFPECDVCKLYLRLVAHREDLTLSSDLVTVLYLHPTPFHAVHLKRNYLYSEQTTHGLPIYKCWANYVWIWATLAKFLKYWAVEPYLPVLLVVSSACFAHGKHITFWKWGVESTHSAWLTRVTVCG